MVVKFALNVDGRLTAVPAEDPDWLTVRGADVLASWPHEYDNDAENALWARSVDWDTVQGYHGGVKQDCGYEAFAMNYAFTALYPYIPSGYDRRLKLVLFDGDTQPQFDAKRRNFYAAFQFFTHYPKKRRMQVDLGISQGLFTEQVRPTIYSIGRRINFLDPQLRFWEWNHTELIHDRSTSIVDGAPQEVCMPKNRFLAACCVSGKYNTSVVKWDLACTLTGFPIDYGGLYMGVRHDLPMHMRNRRRMAMLYPWEYWWGDKAYVGCPHMVTEYKKPQNGQLTAREQDWNITFQHYRARVEHLIREVKGPRLALTTRWRGSFSLLSAVVRINAHMTGLQERMKGPRYDCYGPWPVVSEDIFRRFPKQ